MGSLEQQETGSGHHEPVAGDTEVARGAARGGGSLAQGWCFPGHRVTECPHAAGCDSFSSSISKTLTAATSSIQMELAFGAGVAVEDESFVFCRVVLMVQMVLVVRE